MSTDREGPVDWGELRERLREFYVYAFLPPSVTNDEFDGDSEAESEIDVETATQPTPEPTTADREYGEFEFVEWLASGESGFEPIDIGEGPTEPAESAMPESGPTTGPRLGIKPHPAKAATYALFLAVLTLAVLSVVGYAPVLGPATGLGG
ncbi:hypothetical protein [Natronomonas sp.]|uniref:hypothetical protein n=1 Tax=Natronomonas sp. TaxID=2184060 RepID=UPI002FC3D9C0